MHYEYDAFGNVAQQTLALVNTLTAWYNIEFDAMKNSPVNVTQKAAWQTPWRGGR